MTFSALFVTLAVGEELSLTGAVERLVRLGYRRSDLVVETGDLAVRGGLFDVFPPDRDLAVRVELDGDTIASLRLFDPDSQRSTERLQSVLLPPFSASEESDMARRLMTERIGAGLPEAVHVDLDQPAQFAHQEVDVHTGAAVNVRRVFVGQYCDAHATRLGSRHE